MEAIFNALLKLLNNPDKAALHLLYAQTNRFGRHPLNKTA
jgi:hypothetical protein